MREAAAALLRGTARCAVALKLRVFSRMVACAYRRPGSGCHRLIMAVGRTWCRSGQSGRRSSAFVHWFVDCIYRAQRDLHAARSPRELDLGTAAIGFDRLRIRCSTADANSSTVFLLGSESNLTHFRVYRECASPGTAAVDVGANLGVHSLVMARCVGESGRVCAFEPVAAIRERMAANLVLNGITNVRLRGCALGNDEGRVRFDARAGDFNIGKGCVDARGDLWVSLARMDDELRDLRARVSLVKVDTEGHEVEVLKGAADILRRHRPVVVLEFNPGAYSLADLAGRLPGRYAIWQFPSSHHPRFERVDGPIQRACDLLILPEEHPRSPLQGHRGAA